MNRSQIILAGGAISLVIGSTAALSKSKSEPATNAEIQTSSRLSTQSAIANPAPPLLTATPAPASSSVAAPVQPVALNYAQNYQVDRITTCSGQPNNANFRQSPSLSPSTVLGAVASGGTIYLTGRTAYGDGVNWHEAISPSLFPVPDAGAINNTQPNQVGWIASCFVSG